MLAVRKIIHIDMDAFFASVEQRDNPELMGKAIIVGGKPNGRGVVAACSYEARKFGVTSAMPSATAYRLCPHALFVHPRFEAYQAVSQEVQRIFREYTDIVEPLSLDEAYLDVTGSHLFNGSALRIAQDIRREILHKTQLVASAGVSYNKFLAKIASDIDKPNGCHCILPDEGGAFVQTLPVKRFYGVGKATEARMHALGIETGQDLRNWPLSELQKEFGKSAQYYFNVSRGIDDRPVRAERTRKSVGNERTFGESLTNHQVMLEVLEDLSGQLATKLDELKLCSNTLNIKLRYDDFTTLTRAHKLSAGVFDAQSAKRTLPFLLDRALSVAPQKGKPHVRLLGVSFSGLAPSDDERPQQLDIPF